MSDHGEACGCARCIGLEMSRAMYRAGGGGAGVLSTTEEGFAWARGFLDKPIAMLRANTPETLFRSGSSFAAEDLRKRVLEIIYDRDEAAAREFAKAGWEAWQELWSRWLTNTATAKDIVDTVVQTRPTAHEEALKALKKAARGVL